MYGKGRQVSKYKHVIVLLHITITGNGALSMHTHAHTHTHTHTCTLALTHSQMHTSIHSHTKLTLAVHWHTQTPPLHPPPPPPPHTHIPQSHEAYICSRVPPDTLYILSVVVQHTGTLKLLPLLQYVPHPHTLVSATGGEVGPRPRPIRTLHLILMTLQGTTALEL